MIRTAILCGLLAVACGSTIGAFADPFYVLANMTSDAAPDVDTSITVNVALTAASTNFVSSDIVLSNATMVGFTGSGAAYSFDLRPTAPGTFSATIPAGVFSDSTGSKNVLVKTISRNFVPQQITWAKMTDTPGWTPRAGAAGLVFNDKLWILGGAASPTQFLNDVCYTADGITWTQATAAAPWPPRWNHAALVHDNAMWIIGGATSTDINKGVGDVWTSTDGANWTLITDHPYFGNVSEHCALELTGKMYVLGGYASLGGYGGIFSSIYGIAWPAFSSGGWESRYDGSAVLHNGMVYIMGGYDGGGYLHDVLRSADLTTWTSVTNEPDWWAQKGASAATLDGRIWLTDGESEGQYGNSCWTTVDGIHWGKTQASADLWPAREQAILLNWQRKLWFLSGSKTNSGATSYYGDVWSGEPLGLSGGEGEGEGGGEGEGEGGGDPFGCGGGEIWDDGSFEAKMAIGLDYTNAFRIVLKPATFPCRYTAMCVPLEYLGGGRTDIAIEINGKSFTVTGVGATPSFYTIDINALNIVVQNSAHLPFITVNASNSPECYVAQDADTPASAPLWYSQHTGFDGAVIWRAETTNRPALRFEYTRLAGEGEGEGEGQSTTAPYTTADANHDNTIQIAELSRVIQFYNSAGFHCQAGTEDGYAPGSGDESCPQYLPDFNPQDWSIDFSELLRIVQFYNMGGYHTCSDSHTEDGYCPG